MLSPSDRWLDVLASAYVLLFWYLSRYRLEFSP